MSLRLRDRNKQIPNGLKFYDPATRYTARPYSSISVITNECISARRANPGATAKYSLSTDPEEVANEVDFYNAQVCLKNNWMDYISGGVDANDAAPFIRSRSNLTPSQKLGSVAAGSETLIDWIKSGAEAVPSELAEKRGAVCVECPENAKGDWTRWFTVPISEAIRHALEQRRGMNLSTSHDDKLSCCQVCLCPLKLKIHVPLDDILKKMPAEVQAALPENCWIRRLDA